MNQNSIVNQRILIRRTDTKEIIADTKIIRFTQDTNSVVIRADSLASRGSFEINALVFGTDGLYEFEGTIRGVPVENEITVYLGKHRQTEQRKRPRYPVVLKGELRHIIIQQHDIALRKPIPLSTINMSSGGVLLKMETGSLQIGSHFQTALYLEQKKMILDGVVVRTQNCGLETEEYGCRVSQYML